jgi:hypothetical protein
VTGRLRERPKHPVTVCGTWRTTGVRSRSRRSVAALPRHYRFRVWLSHKSATTAVCCRSVQRPGCHPRLVRRAVEGSPPRPASSLGISPTPSTYATATRGSSGAANEPASDRVTVAWTNLSSGRHATRGRTPLLLSTSGRHHWRQPYACSGRAPRIPRTAIGAGVAPAPAATHRCRRAPCETAADHRGPRRRRASPGAKFHGLAARYRLNRMST